MRAAASLRFFRVSFFLFRDRACFPTMNTRRDTLTVNFVSFNHNIIKLLLFYFYFYSDFCSCHTNMLMMCENKINFVSGKTFPFLFSNNSDNEYYSLGNKNGILLWRTITHWRTNRETNNKALQITILNSKHNMWPSLPLQRESP
jgi:hypothetical protein